MLGVACSSPSAPGPESACPEGVELFSRWQGEYPAPVIHVRESVDLPVFDHPCSPKPTSRCTLQPGVYHPWGEGEAFGTVRPVEPFRARQEFSLEGTVVRKGETVEILGYLGEGYCTWRLRGEELAAECGDMESIPVEALPAADHPERQFFRAGCEGWILVDDDLLARPEIARGTVSGYGKVGPSEP